MQHATQVRWGAAAVFAAPTVLAAAMFLHPWIGNPGDAGSLETLAAAVADEPTRWLVSHIGAAVGSGFMILAFLAVRAWLRGAGEDTWSAAGLPFVVLGSVLFALLPALEFAPMAASDAGADVAAVQAALLPYFIPILATSGVLFLIGTAAFIGGIAAGGVLDRTTTWVVGTALLVVAVARLLPLGVVLLYVGPVASLVAFWPLAYVMWRSAPATPATGLPSASVT